MKSMMAQMKDMSSFMTEMEVKMEETNQSVKTLEAKVINNEKTLVGTIEDVVAGVVEDCVSEKIKEILP